MPRLPERNKQTIYYALYSTKTPNVDSAGRRTGTWTITYGDPVSAKMTVSGAKGAADIAVFGVDLNYNKVLYTDDINCPIKEDSVLWVGADPNNDEYNYVVVRIAKGLTNIAYAIREVNVSNA